MSKIIIVNTDNAARTEEAKAPMLKALQAAVGGLIEIVHPIGLSEPYVMVVNEEGMILRLDVNPIGSLLYGAHIHGQPILGNIAILKEGFVDGEPDLIPLDDYEAEGLLMSVKDFFK